MAAVSRARHALVVLWGCAFLAAMAIMIILDLGHYIEHDNFITGVNRINQLYAPYIGTIGAFYWTQRHRSGPPGEPMDRTSVALAFAVSLLWNGVVLVSLALLVFDIGTIEDALDTMSTLSTFAWPLALAMGFYFGRQPLDASRPAGSE